MQRAQVAVILVNYNSLKDTNECILSLSESIVKPFIIIVDNCSDNAEKIAACLINYKFGLQLLLLPQNIGFGRANNAGINWLNENVKPDFVLLLNNDTIVYPNTITDLINAFEVDEKIALTTCKIMYYHDPKLVWYGGGNLIRNKGKLIIADFGKKASEHGAAKSRYVDFASGCAMMFKSSVLNLAGGFDDRFFMYIEDLDLCLTVLGLNYKIWYTAKTSLLHKVHGSSYNSTKKLPALHPDNPELNFFIYHFTKNTLLTMRKHLTNTEWRKFLSYYFALMSYRNGTYLFKRKFKANLNFLRAISDFKKEAKLLHKG